MVKTVRISIASVMIAFGVLFFILPGSILFLIGGLVLLSVDVPMARNWLRTCQNQMTVGARKLDRFLLNRKLRRR